MTAAGLVPGRVTVVCCVPLARLTQGPPCLALPLLCSGIELIVPHDCEPGPSERYLELYLKALETVRGPRMREAEGLGQAIMHEAWGWSQPAACVAAERLMLEGMCLPYHGLSRI